MTDTVHQAGGKIVAQLANAGNFGVQELCGLTLADSTAASKMRAKAAINAVELPGGAAL